MASKRRRRAARACLALPVRSRAPRGALLMCDEAEEYYTVFRESKVRARKSHACCACKETIEPKHIYYRTFTVFDGDSATYKHCVRCMKMLNAILNARESGVAVDMRLNCGELWSQTIGDVPDHIAALAFMTPAEAQERCAS